MMSVSPILLQTGVFSLLLVICFYLKYLKIHLHFLAHILLFVCIGIMAEVVILVWIMNMVFGFGFVTKLFLFFPMFVSYLTLSSVPYVWYKSDLNQPAQVLCGTPMTSLPMFYTGLLQKNLPMFVLYLTLNSLYMFHTGLTLSRLPMFI